MEAQVDLIIRDESFQLRGKELAINLSSSNNSSSTDATEDRLDAELDMTTSCDDDELISDQDHAIRMATEKKQDKKKVAYVETSLDDLSYSSSDDDEHADESRERKASGESAGEEEDEKRLLLQLRNQQKQQHLKQLQAQQQQQQQQQQQALMEQQNLESQANQMRQQQQQACFHGNQQQAPRRGDPDDDDEIAPEVPVRRSSQTATGNLVSSSAAPTSAAPHRHHPPRQPRDVGGNARINSAQYTSTFLGNNNNRASLGPGSNKKVANIDQITTGGHHRPLPRAPPTSSDSRWVCPERPPPPPISRQQQQLKRPSQPPPPPPPLLDELMQKNPEEEALRVAEQQLSRSHHRAANVPKSQHIWSPSNSSSLASSGSLTDMAPPMSLNRNSLSGGTLADFSLTSTANNSMSPPNTVVERNKQTTSGRHLSDHQEATLMMENKSSSGEVPLVASEIVGSQIVVAAQQPAAGKVEERNVGDDGKGAIKAQGKIDDDAVGPPPMAAMETAADRQRQQQRAKRTASVDRCTNQQIDDDVSTSKPSAAASGNNNNNMRSFSIATSTLSGLQESRGKVGRQNLMTTAKLSEQGNENSREQLLGKKYWTLPPPSTTQSQIGGNDDAEEENSTTMARSLSYLKTTTSKSKLTTTYTTSTAADLEDSRRSYSSELQNIQQEEEEEKRPTDVNDDYEKENESRSNSNSVACNTASNINNNNNNNREAVADEYSSIRKTAANRATTVSNELPTTSSADHVAAHHRLDSNSKIDEFELYGRQQQQNIDDDSQVREKVYGQNDRSNLATKKEEEERMENQNQVRPNPISKEEWFKQMYRKMHGPPPKQQQEPGSSSIKTSQPSADQTAQIKIKLKNDHRYSPSYTSQEEDFLAGRKHKNFISPNFKPGNICDYLPGRAGITSQQQQHERNLNLYYKLIDHIDQVFSSVLPEVTSRSFNTLQAIRSSSNRRSINSASTQLKKRQLHQTSKSGPQTPVSTLTRRGEYYREPLKGGIDDEADDRHEHERRCVFNRLLKEDDGSNYPNHQLINNENEQGGEEDDDDPRKQYVAVQHGHDIPLKGLRRPAPQPNIYKVGPAPPMPPIERQSFYLLANDGAQQQQKLRGQTLGGRSSMYECQRHNNYATTKVNELALPQRSSSVNRDFLRTKSDDDEIYKDFENVYESLKRKPSTSKRQPRTCNYQQQQQLDCMWSPKVAVETEALDKSLCDVEEALKRVTLIETSDTNSTAKITTDHNNHQEAAQQQLLQPDSPGSTYGKLISVCSSRTQQQAPSPMSSIVSASDTVTTNRADSRQSYSQWNGPALVEEMTLSDLEEEISSSLMATKEKRKLILKTMRCQDSYMFSDESINIHYRAPTSKLLKMNTFNEFELNKLKKFYADRLRAADNCYYTNEQPATDEQLQRQLHWLNNNNNSNQNNNLNLQDLDERRRQAQSVERLYVTTQNQPYHYHQQPFIDLNRYQRAFLLKPSSEQLPIKQAKGGGNKQHIKFGRALFDFQAKSDGELSMKRGDLLKMLELLDHQWARVEDCQSGLQGLVPLNYIDYSVGCGVAKRDVLGEQRVLRNNNDSTSSLLPMNKGEPITLIRRLSGHWYEASNTKQAMGLVWSNDLDIIKQPVLQQKHKLKHDDDDDGDVMERHERRKATGRHHQKQQQANCCQRKSSSRATTRLGDEFTDDDDHRRRNKLSDDYYGDGDDEEEMLIFESGERVLARRRTRSASGRCCGGQQLEATIPSSGGGGVPTTTKPTTRPAMTSYCCQLKDCSSQQSSNNNCMLTTTRRSSSSPYISTLAGSGGKYPLPANQQQLVRPSTSGGLGITQQHQPSADELPRLYRAKYAYKPRQKDELELIVDDILVVVHQCDDGWWLGSSYTTKESGTFPGNFVEPIFGR